MSTSSQTKKAVASKPKKQVHPHAEYIPLTETQQKYATVQAQEGFKKIFISWLPKDSNTFLFELVVVIYLIIAVIHFGLTGDTLMIVTLLPYVAASKGLTEVRPLLSKGKKESDKQHLSEDK